MYLKKLYIMRLKFLLFFITVLVVYNLSFSQNVDGNKSHDSDKGVSL